MPGRLKNWIRNQVSRPALQPLWSKLLKLCHAGMNYGGGQSVENSGEIEALVFAMNSLADKSHIVLFDVGANNGEYLGVAFKMLGPDARIFAFEPQSSSFSELEAGFASEPRVKLTHAAVSAEVGSAGLFFSSDGQSTASLYRDKNAVIFERRKPG